MDHKPAWIIRWRYCGGRGTSENPDGRGHCLLQPGGNQGICKGHECELSPGKMVLTQKRNLIAAGSAYDGKCPAGLTRLMYTMKSSRNIHMNERWPARWGITLIPPESLPSFQEIVITDKRIGRCMLPGLYR